jgi:hypothetical protein
MLPVNLADAFSQGDLIGRVAATGIGFRASSQAWDTDLATTRAAFVVLFAGVAEQEKTAAENVYGNGERFKLHLRISTGGVNRYALKAGTYKYGDFLGPAKQTGDLLEDQVLEIVSTEAQATHKFVGSDTTLVNPGYGDAEKLSRVFRSAAAT